MSSLISYQQVRRESWMVGGIGVLLFMAGFWQQPFIEFETRFALFAQEMLRHGPALFPTTYGEPYPDYPVAGTLLIWLCSLPFGAVTKFSAILPTALASAFNLMLVYRLLARHFRSWAVLAISLQLMTATFLAQARSISLDQLVATITLLAFYLAYVADTEKRRELSRWLPLVLLAGFAVRGPLGVVIPTGVVLAYYALTAQWRNVWHFGVLALLVLAMAWSAMLALAAHYYGVDFMHEVVRMQVVGRLETTDTPKFWYYFTSSFGNYALAYPLALLVAVLTVPSLLRQPRNDMNKLLLGLTAAALIVLVGLSIPHTKKPRYLLPMVPAIAALAASMWSVHRSRILAGFASALEKLFMAMPMVLAIALAVAHHRLKHHAVQLSLSPLYMALALCQLAIVGIILKRKSIIAATGLSQPALLSVVAALALWLVNLLAVEPVLLQTRDTATFVQQAEALRRAQPAPLALFGMLKDGQAIKYMVNIDYDLQPIFVRDADELAALPLPVYLMIDNRELPKLPAALQARLQPVLQGHFDNRVYSVLLLAH
jgi:4-amino-4-deoxy-L-arabinose transferase-like glycosyltransferase